MGKIEKTSMEGVIISNNIFVMKKCEEKVEIQEIMMRKILYLTS